MSDRDQLKVLTMYKASDPKTMKEGRSLSLPAAAQATSVTLYYLQLNDLNYTGTVI